MTAINKGFLDFDSDSSTYTLSRDIELISDQYFSLTNGETFDGNEFTITVKNVNGFKGLFRELSGNTVIKNVTVSASGTTTLSGTESTTDHPDTGKIVCAGWIIGGDQSGFTVYNCHSNGNINKFCGGICGNFCNGAVNKCSSSGNIFERAGGIVGSCFAGITNSTISECFSRGSISNNAGGICGQKTAASNKNITLKIEHSYSLGQFVSSATNAGGILGYQSGLTTGNTNRIFISNCYSSAELSETSKNGGIIAKHSGKNIFMYNTFTSQQNQNSVRQYTGTKLSVQNGVIIDANRGSDQIYIPINETSRIHGIKSLSDLSVAALNTGVTPKWTIGESTPVLRSFQPIPVIEQILAQVDNVVKTTYIPPVNGGYYGKSGGNIVLQDTVKPPSSLSAVPPQDGGFGILPLSRKSMSRISMQIKTSKMTELEANKMRKYGNSRSKDGASVIQKKKMTAIGFTKQGEGHKMKTSTAEQSLSRLRNR